MQGFITERNFAEAEKCFPGLCAYYYAMPRKPLTFLELIWQFELRSSPARKIRQRCKRR
jgi:hypothetical protein